MEVHHHPDLHHKRKKFAEYFLEFIMIFLAVTLGFFAESYRESISDHIKEGEYMKGMVSNLKIDIKEFDSEVVYWHSIDLNTDTVLSILKQPVISPENVKKIYQCVGQRFYRYDLLKYNNYTVEELKSSGNFRLVKNAAAKDSIMKYNNDVEYFLGQEKSMELMQHDFKAAERRVLDYKYFSSAPYLKDFTISLMSNSPVLLSNDKLLVNDYYNSLFNYSLLSSLHVKLLKNLKQEAGQLSSMINKQYKLDEE